MRVHEPRETSTPACLFWQLSLALEGDCRWRLELSEARSMVGAAHEAPRLLLRVSVYVCYLSGNVQITKIFSFLHCICCFWHTLLMILGADRTRGQAPVVDFLADVAFRPWHWRSLLRKLSIYTYLLALGLCVCECGQGFVFCSFHNRLSERFQLLSGRDSREGVFDLNYIFSLVTVCVFGFNCLETVGRRKSHETMCYYVLLGVIRSRTLFAVCFCFFFLHVYLAYQGYYQCTRMVDSSCLP